MSLPNDIYSQRILELAALDPEDEAAGRSWGDCHGAFETLRQHGDGRSRDEGGRRHRLRPDRQGLSARTDLGLSHGPRNCGLKRSRASYRRGRDAEDAERGRTGPFRSLGRSCRAGTGPRLQSPACLDAARVRRGGERHCRDRGEAQARSSLRARSRRPRCETQIDWSNDARLSEKKSPWLDPAGVTPRLGSLYPAPFGEQTCRPREAGARRSAWSQSIRRQSGHARARKLVVAAALARQRGSNSSTCWRARLTLITDFR